MSGSRTPALSKVEFIVTGAAIAMFSVKLVFLLYISSVVPEINFCAIVHRRFFNYGYVQTNFVFLSYLCSSSPSNFTPIANNIIVSAFSIFSNMI